MASALVKRRSQVFAAGLLCLAVGGLAPGSLLAQDAVNQETVAEIAGAVEQTTTPAALASPAGGQAPDQANRRFSFNFAHQPWKAVLEWYAKEADLALSMEATPPGTFNYNDTRRYSANEALDVLNRVLYSTKGFLLVKHDKMLVLVDMDANEVDPALIPEVPLDELNSRADYELVRVIFPVWNMTAEQAAQQVQQLLGPKMKVVTLPQSRQIQVTELVLKQRTIRQIIEAGNQPGPGGFRPFTLKHVSLDVALPTLRQALGMPAGADETPDRTPNSPPSARITRSAMGNTLLFQGTAEGAARVEQVLNLIDVPANGVELSRQIEIYSLGTIDVETARKVFDEMFRGNPSVTVMVDAASGNITAVAPPSIHATIRATLDMMQKDARQVAVIPLVRMDPLSAKTIVSSMFGGTGTAEQPNPNAVSVDYDTAQRVLIVRGTKTQLTQVREMLAQLGEAADSKAGIAGGQRIRRLNYPQASALSAIYQIQKLMPDLGGRITVLSPQSGIAVRRPNSGLDGSPIAPPSPLPNSSGPQTPPPAERTPSIFERFQNGSPATPQPATPPRDRGTNAATQSLFRFAAQESPAAPEAEQQTAPAAAPASNPPVEAPQSAAQSGSPTAAAQTPAADGKGRPIVIIPGPTGLVVVSEDTEALDQLEEWMTLVTPSSSPTERQFAVYYLRYTTADAAAAVLAGFYGTGNAGGGRGGGRGRGRGNLVEDLTGSIVEQIAGNATSAIGGLIGGATGFASAAVDIVPLIDHNAVLVRAKQDDLAMIEQILDVLDQRSGPVEDESDPEPRRIQVVNMAAADMATIVQSVYADRIAGADGGAGQNVQLAQILGGGTAQQQPQKMTCTVDTRNNQLIVRAPEDLFEKVQKLVQELDQISTDGETTVVLPITSAALPTLQRAFDGIGTPQQQTAGNNNRGAQPGQRGAGGQLNNLQQLQQLQQLFGGGRGGGRGQAGGAGGRGGGAALGGAAGRGGGRGGARRGGRGG